MESLDIALKECIVYGSVKLSSGEDSTVYIDIKRAYGNPLILNKIAQEIYVRMDQRATGVAGSDYGGIPLATALSVRYNLYLTLTRKSPKSHGTERMLEGHIPNNQDRLIVVDDVFTTGHSLAETIKILESTQAEILGAAVVVKRNEGNFGYPLLSLFTLEDLYTPCKEN